MTTRIVLRRRPAPAGDRRSFLTRRAALLLVLLLATLPRLAAAAGAEDDVRAAIRAGDAVAALAAADAALATAGDAAATDELLYLRAIAAVAAERPGAAIESLRRLLAGAPDSPRFHAARFLLARTLAGQRAFDEAERILREEATRLRAPERRREIAGVLVELADALSDPGKPDLLRPTPPDDARAALLLREALRLEVDEAFEERVRAQLVATLARTGDLVQVIQEAERYLRALDPDWSGPPFAPSRPETRATRRGDHVAEVRLALARARSCESYEESRIEFENLLSVPALVADPAVRAAAMWGIVTTWDLPAVFSTAEVERGIAAARAFAAAWPEHPRAAQAAWLVHETLYGQGRSDDAVEQCAEIVAGDAFRMPTGAAARLVLEDLGVPAEEYAAQVVARAHLAAGQTRYEQGRYAEAIDWWRRFCARYPDAAEWSAAQRRIVDAEVETALDAIASDDEAAARAAIDAFLRAHPLDARTPSLMLALGMIDAVAGEKLLGDDTAPLGLVAASSESAERAEARRRLLAALDAWERLASRWAGDDAASHALFRAAVLREERLGDLPGAVAGYRRVDFGPMRDDAQRRLAELLRPHLAVATERVFRTSEQPEIRLEVRNAKRFVVRSWRIDLESWFRRRHSARGIESLDTGLVEPDATFTYEIEDFEDYRTFVRQVPVGQLVPASLPGASGPGAWVVTVGTDDLEATTLVLRSDLDVALRAGREDLVAWAQADGAAAAGVKILVTDGAAIIGEGTTDSEGLMPFASERLASAGTLGLLALRDGHVAAVGGSLDAVRRAAVLAARGLVHLDRPAYRPGQTVHARAILRGVADGRYVAPSGAMADVVLLDPRGRPLQRTAHAIGRFGTVVVDVTLPADAATGDWSLRVEPDRASRIPAVATTVPVADFTLGRLALSIEPDRLWIHRGEALEATIRAQWDWGAPAADLELRLILPNRRERALRTDDEGLARITWDSIGAEPGDSLTLLAMGDEENAAGRATVRVVDSDLTLDVATTRDRVAVGEAFEATLRATTPDGAAAAAQATLTVERRAEAPPHPVLAAVNWLRPSGAPPVWTTIEERRIAIDATTGRATTVLRLEAPGVHRLRLAAADAKGRTTTAEVTLFADLDPGRQALRFDTDRDSLEVGEQVSIALLAERDGLALVTVEGARTIERRVLRVKAGENPVMLAVADLHWPDVMLAAVMLEGRELRVAERPFVVERRLKLALELATTRVAPGATVPLRVVATDGLGRPVEAEIDLALHATDLLRRYPDETPELAEFFARGTRRAVERLTLASNGYRYDGVVRAAPRALLAEQERLASEAQEAIDRVGAIAELGSVRAKSIAPSAPAPGRAGEAPMEALRADARQSGSGAGGFGGGSGGGSLFGSAAADDDSWSEPETEARDPGLDLAWSGTIVTDAEGEAIVEIPVPDDQRSWRLLARGAGDGTLVGQVETSFLSQRSLFVELRAPERAVAGDRLGLVARVHLADGAEREGVAALVLLGADGRPLASQRRSVVLSRERPVQVRFDDLELPAGALRLRVAIESDGASDALEQPLLVEPWGATLAAHAGGVAERSVEARLLLDDAASARRLLVRVGPDLRQEVIDRARAASAGPALLGAASDLLAASRGLAYARRHGAARSDLEDLERRARMLVTVLLERRDDDGSWTFPGGRDDGEETAEAIWALTEARAAGIEVDPDAIVAGIARLEADLRRAGPEEHERRAITLHALARAGSATFEHANALRRLRNELTPRALAATAMTFALIERPEIADEVAAVLEARARPLGTGGIVFAGDGAAGRLRSEAASVAWSALALAEARPASTLLPGLVEALLASGGGRCLPPGPRDGGVAVAALAAWFGTAARVDDAFRVVVHVEGRPVGTILGGAVGAEREVTVDAAALPERGPVVVRLDMTGRGRFVWGATLEGFVPGHPDLPAAPLPAVRSRRYLHDKLAFEGEVLEAASTSPIRELALGARSRVEVTFDNRSAIGDLLVEEPLPAGARLVTGSVEAGGLEHRLDRGRLVILVPRGRTLPGLRYEIAGAATGAWRVAPTRVSAIDDPALRRFGEEASMRVLDPGALSEEAYVMNDAERFELGARLFAADRHGEALPYLEPLFDRARRYRESDVAKMLLWIRTEPAQFDARRVVDAFEALALRSPELDIPFAKIPVVARAYLELGEVERAWLVHRATIEASFLDDARIGALLDDQGRPLEAIAYERSLAAEYPASAAVESSMLASAQRLVELAPRAASLAPAPDGTRATGPGLLAAAVRLYDDFMIRFPESPLAPTAAFGRVEALLELRDDRGAAEEAEAWSRRFVEEPWISTFRYMAAIGRFRLREDDAAIALAAPVAESKSENAALAAYVIGQVHHARGESAEAVAWYRKVASRFPDAAEAIEYFLARRLALPETSIVRPGAPVTIPLTHRNVPSVRLAVYRVDLMALYLREGSLARIGEVELSGIAPLLERDVACPDGAGELDGELRVELDLPGDGAYLVMARGADRFASGLVLVTPLDVAVQEEPRSGRVRVNLVDVTTGERPSGVHVKAIGSADGRFRAGDSDPRGVFVADGLQGTATILARDDDGRYAFHRGTTWLGSPQRGRGQAVDPAGKGAMPEANVDWFSNVRTLGSEIRRKQSQAWDAQRRDERRGVTIQTAQ